MSINQWMDKGNILYPDNEMRFSYKKEWSADACCNMDEPRRHLGKSIKTESSLVVVMERWGKRKKSEVTQSCPTLCVPMDTRLLRPWEFPGKSSGVGFHFLLQGTSRPRDRTQVSDIVDGCFPSEPPLDLSQKAKKWWGVTANRYGVSFSG